jgi:hypothetical protein
MAQSHAQLQSDLPRPDVFAAAAHGRDLLVASLRTWSAETRAFVDDLAKDGAQALDGLQRCRTPLDLWLVEQRWFMARARSWVDAGVRVMAGAAHEPESAAAESADFRLPE